ncbi:MAG: LemA family protein [Nitrospirota bacterium]|nr:LemA family protein [Nitrospirota bacterium]
MEQSNHIMPLLTVALVLIPLGVMVWEVMHLAQLTRWRDEAWKRLEGDLRDRHGLATQLVTIATQYIPWKDPVVEAVNQCRLRAMGTRNVGDRVAAEADLSWALARLILRMDEEGGLERHADFSSLAEKLSKAENHVARTRVEYNRSARVIANRSDHLLTRIAARFSPLPQVETFDLDPLLARQSMMSALAAGMVRTQSRPAPETPEPEPTRTVA